MKNDPYLAFYDLKFMHMEQAGLTERLENQWKPFKVMELDVLEPLKLKHFYLTMIGNAIGLLISSIAFAGEKFQLKLKLKNKTKEKIVR